MTDKTLADIMREDNEREALQSWRKASKLGADNYTGNACPSCGRYRLFVCNDERVRCEKCPYVGTKTHELKLNSDYYALVRDGYKRFELRKNDRDFMVGDTLYLREWVTPGHYYSSRPALLKTVSFILSHTEHSGLHDGYVILSLDASYNMGAASNLDVSV